MDIISNLPDPILCHILSFLPVHFSVRTSILARRWKFLWTSVRNLRFEEQCYGPQTEKIKDFPDMVYRVLLLHNGLIDGLTISPHDSTISHCQMDAWISTAIARNVQVLHLSGIFEFPVPERCFKCKTLVELTIECCTIYVKPGSVCLPKLKNLNLLYNSFEDAESLRILISGCVSIEDLLLVIRMDDMDCNVCSPTLKSLKLTCYNGDHKHKLVLDIPAIQYLFINNENTCVIYSENLSSLVAADIYLSHDFLSEDEEAHDFLSEDEEDIRCFRDTFQFLEKVCNAKRLTFASSALMKLSNPVFSIATTRFHNLTQLKFDADWHILTELLESAYKLESLIIKEVVDKLKCWREPKHLPECLSSSLKYVYIFGFAGKEDELNMVRYILKRAKILKTIKIHSVPDYHVSKQETRQRISYSRRGSKNCRLTFY